MKKIFIYYFAFIGAASAQEVGTGLSFLKLGVGARPIAMGEAGTAAATDHASLIYNPAAPRFTPDDEILLMHKEWIAETTTDYLGATVVGENFSYGFTALNTSVGNIQVRTKPGPAEGTFSAQNFSLGAAVSYSLDEHVAVGIAGKFLYEKIFADEASGYGFDLGGLYRYSDELKFGASVLHIGSMSALRRQPTIVPTTVRIGAAYSSPMLEQIAVTGAADLVKTLEDQYTHLHMGIESTYDRLLSVRAGYKTGYVEQSFSVGFGVSYDIMKFDYAFVPFTGGFNSTHTFSLAFLL